MSFEESENTNIYKEKYFSKADQHGYIKTSDLATQELGRQNKSIASLLDGDEGVSEFNLGKGL